MKGYRKTTGDYLYVCHLLRVTRAILMMALLNNVFTESTEQIVTKDYCEEETFSAKCVNDEVILIQAARYGRMRTGSCLSSQYGSLGCWRDLVPELDRACSGQPTCKLGVRELIHHNPCPRELRSYLEVQYTCIKVIVPDNHRCLQSSFLVHPPSGYLSNYVTEQTGCGSYDSPWQIVASRGQRINVTLWDFGPPATGTQEAGGQGGSVCQVLAIIKDGTKSETVCGGRGRVSWAYLSSSSEVQVRMVVKTRREASGRYVLLKYEVTGCADVPLSSGTWIRRISSTEALVGCTTRSDSWRLTCENELWTGALGNCSEGLSSWADGLSKRGVFQLPLGMNVTITAIVATTIGLFVVIAGLVVVRRKYTIWRQTPKSDVYHQNGAAPTVRCSVQANNESLPVLPKTVPPVHIRGANYSRTWEVQRQQDFRLTPCPGNPQTSYRIRILNESPPRYVEHIYESPKSVRKAIEGNAGRERERETDKESGTGGGGGAEYYEIDPCLTKEAPDLYQMSP